MSSSHATVALTSALVIAATSSAQRVLVVDAAAPGAAFSTIQAAVDAAHLGDTVLVKPGSYAGATVSSFLQLIADGAGVTLTSAIVIDGLVAPELVRISGFGVSAAGWTAASPFVVVRSCSGPVWIEDCQLVGHQLGGGNGAAARVESSTAVTVQRCRLWVTSFTGNQTMPGLSADLSTVHVFDSEIIGSDAALGSMGCFPSDGGPGIFAFESVLHLHDVTARGGPGIALPGGPGLMGLGLSTLVIERGSSFVGGDWTCGTGPAGSPTFLLGATLRSLAGVPLTLTTARVVRELDAVDFTIDGAPGAAVALCFHHAPAPIYMPSLDASLLLGISFAPVPLGTIPAAGTRVVQSRAPTLGPGTNERTYYVQAMAIDPSMRVISGSGQAITVLGAQF